MEKVKLNTDIPTNENGTNANIKFHILDSETMKKERFQYNGETYFYHCEIPYLDELDLDITYDIEDDLLTIMAFDWGCGQPYDYQYFIKMSEKNHTDPKKEWIGIKEFVESKVLHLQEVGILSGYNKNDII